MERFCDLKQKEVINICDGCRLGFVQDLVLDLPSGRILKIIVPAQGKLLGLFGGDKEYRIPWACIRKIGDDIILVEVNVDSVFCDVGLEY